MNSGPSQPPGYSGLNPDQIAMVNKVGYFMDPSAVLPGGQQWQQPAGYSGLNPSQIQAVNEQGFYTNPDAARQNTLWDRLMNVVGQGTMPKLPSGPTSMPPGSNAMGPAGIPPPLPQGQMPAPRGMGGYFQSLQNPASGGGNSALMAQYMALQQLMRGA